MKQSHFRLFCIEKWFEHKDEVMLWTGNLVEYDDAYYFRKHRWLLKKMFQEHQKQLTSEQTEVILYRQ